MNWPQIATLVVFLSIASRLASAQDRPSIRVLWPESNGWFRLEAPGEPEKVYTLEASADLDNWFPIAKVHDGLLPFSDPASAAVSSRFYRISSAPRISVDDWKNQIQTPLDAFLSERTGATPDEIQWVKFAVVLSDPARVYYQDSRKYLFHYDFAAKRLDPFLGLSRPAFDQVSLRSNGQKVVLGAVLVPVNSNVSEYGIQLVGLDPYPKETVASLFELVKSTIVAGPSVRAYYVPSYEQTPSAQADRTFFEAKGITVASIDRWIQGNQTYSTGWAMGRLKFFPATEIRTAFTQGRLLPQDILLTDGIPAEIPVLAGMISLAAATPNSHVAILARSFGIPLVYLADPTDRDRALQLANQDVVLRAGQPDEGGKIDLIPLDPAIDPALRAEILALKNPPPIQIPIKQRFGALSASTDRLGPTDIQYFGGKAAHFGLLRRSIPTNSPVAIAFSIDLWDDFMNQTLATGKTLRAEITERLAGTAYPPNMPVLSANLAAVRKLITDTARFSLAQQQEIIAALKGFQPGQNIRFRSSTNVEDSEQFTGAGLYDSYSGCLGDDLDNDDRGPCQCDPTEAKERGVFRAIQKVYASFYNDNAYLERLRHRINEEQVGMGMLVHYSAPDETEMANGVATLQVRISSFSTNFVTQLVTQLGAVSVSNPEGGARPETVTASRFSRETYLTRLEQSSLVQLGASVMAWETDYRALMELLYKVVAEFQKHHPEKKTFTLDFEYKKLRPGVLSVKQVRQVPEAPESSGGPAFLLNEPNEFVLYQGEFGDVFSNHRLKTETSFQIKNLRWAAPDRKQDIYSDVRLSYVEGTEVRSLTGAPSSFPDAAFSSDGALARHSWSLGTGTTRRDFALVTDLSRYTTRDTSPIYVLRDFGLDLTVGFAAPLPVVDPEGKSSATAKYTVRLQARPALTPNRVLVERKIVGANKSGDGGGVEIQTRFYWPKPTGRGIGDKTAPLLHFVETQIIGLTTQPIQLKGYYSQTYRPGHHNFWEEFIFEPRLDENLAPAVLSELEALNVQLIYAFWGDGTTRLQALGFDGQFRPLDGTASPGGGRALSGN